MSYERRVYELEDGIEAYIGLAILELDVDPRRDDGASPMLS